MQRMWLARLGVQFVLVLRADYIAMMEEREVPCCVKGHHVYQAMWVAVVGEELACEREPTNASDRYAVAVLKDGVIIGHLPRKVSKICSLYF